MKDPFKVGQEDLTQKVEIDYEAIMNDPAYWDSDWSASNDGVILKHRKEKKTVAKHPIEAGYSSVVQRLKAASKRKKASNIAPTSYFEFVILDDDTSPQDDDLRTWGFRKQVAPSQR